MQGDFIVVWELYILLCYEIDRNQSQARCKDQETKKQRTHKDRQRDTRFNVETLKGKTM